MKDFWLVKTEPTTFSIDDLKISPKKTTHWEGVRNYQARNFMRDKMKKGDEVLIYHSNCKEIGVVGIGTVSKNAYPDHYALDKRSKYYDSKSSKEKNPWVMVDIKYKKKFKEVISLKNLKEQKKLKAMQLLKKGNRLSILPVSEKEFDHIIKMEGEIKKMQPSENEKSKLAPVKKNNGQKVIEGKKAPLFSLKNQKGKTISLKDFIGKKNIVVYFYPKALTPGCTVQACEITNSKKDFKRLNTVVLGVSPDNVNKLLNFENQKKLNFDLLSDEDKSVANKYGVWGKKKFMGREYMGILRTTFIIGKDGKVKHIMDKVKTKTHHQNVIDYIGENL